MKCNETRNEEGASDICFILNKILSELINKKDNVIEKERFYYKYGGVGEGMDHKYFIYDKENKDSFNLRYNEDQAKEICKALNKEGLRK